ncbi:MAG: GntR family transcriptional regulator [Pseudomonadales bacterium]
MQNTLERKTKAEQAAELLEAAIINCSIQPGAVMTETEISEMLDIGRTPVREALMKLANENLVRLSRAGVVVPELNPITMLKLLEPRELIEKLSIEKAVLRLNEEDLQSIRAVHSELSTVIATDREAFMAVLSKIHNIVAQSSKNEFISGSIKTTQGLSRRFWCYYASDQDQTFCTELYLEQLQALQARDLESALACSSRLIHYLQDFAKKQLDNFS